MSIKYNGKLIAGKYKTQIVTDATESNKGLIRIATQEEINAGTDNTTAVTPKGLATKQNKLTAGTGIEILPDGTINNTQTSAEWGNIQGDIINQSDLIDKFDKKQDVISDLVTIREGASKGATALQSYTETDPIYTADKHKIATKQELTTGLSEKQDKLTAGKNIKISSENVISATIDLTYDEKNCRMVFGG